MSSLPALHEIFDLTTSKLITLLSSTLPARLREVAHDEARNELQEYMEMVANELDERQTTYDWIEKEMKHKYTQEPKHHHSTPMNTTTPDAVTAPLQHHPTTTVSNHQASHSSSPHELHLTSCGASQGAAIFTSTTTNNHPTHSSPKRKRKQILEPQKSHTHPPQLATHPLPHSHTQAKPATPSPTHQKKLFHGKTELSPPSPIIRSPSALSPSSSHKRLSLHSNFSTTTSHHSSSTSPSNRLKSDKRLKYEINKNVYHNPQVELPKSKLTDDFKRTVKAKVDTKVVKVTHMSRGVTGGFFIVNPNRMRREMLLKQKKKRKKKQKENVVKKASKNSPSKASTTSMRTTKTTSRKPSVPKRPSQSAPRTLNAGEKYLSKTTSPVHKPNMLHQLNRSFSESKLMRHVHETSLDNVDETENAEEILTEDSDVQETSSMDSEVKIVQPTDSFALSTEDQPQNLEPIHMEQSEDSLSSTREDNLPIEKSSINSGDGERSITLLVPDDPTSAPNDLSNVAEVESICNNVLTEEASVADDTDFIDAKMEAEILEENMDPHILSPQKGVPTKAPLLLVTPAGKSRRVLLSGATLEILSVGNESYEHRVPDKHQIRSPFRPAENEQRESPDVGDTTDNESDGDSVVSLALSDGSSDSRGDSFSFICESKSDVSHHQGYREQIQKQVEEYKKCKEAKKERNAPQDDTSSKSSTSQSDNTPANPYQHVKRSKKISIFERRISRKHLFHLRKSLVSRLSNSDAFQKKTELSEQDMHGTYFERLTEQVQDLDPVFVVRFLDERCCKSFPEAQRQLLDRCSSWKRIISEKVDYSHLYTSFYDIFTASHRSVITESEVATITNNRVKRSSRSHAEHDENYSVLLTKVLEQLDQWHVAAPLENGSNCLYSCILNNREEVYEIVSGATTAHSDSTEWMENPPHNDSWNLYWSWSRPQVERHKLLIWQKINHFSNAKQLTSKDFLKRSIDRFTRVPGRKRDEFSIMPPTFSLPHEYIKLVEMYAENDGRPWIVKPIGQSRGRGIRIVTDISRVDHNEHVVVQRYIENPLLLDGYKFDLRIYVLVTHFQPLEAFIYTDGFARFASEKFSLDTQSFKDVFIHLTNTSIQQKAMKGTQKILISELADRLKTLGYDWDTIFERIVSTIIKSLVCVEDLIAEPKHATEGPRLDVNSFELFGYDVLLTDTSDCWLLEVNASPSMEKHDIIDSLKDSLIRDTIKVVDPIYFDRWALKSIIERRLEGKKKRSYRRTSVHTQSELNDDLKAILHGRMPRMYGEEPSCLSETKYRRIAPGPVYKKMRRIRK